MLKIKKSKKMIFKFSYFKNKKMSELKQEVYTFEDLNNRFEAKINNNSKIFLEDFISSIKEIQEGENILIVILDKDTGEKYEENFDHFAINNFYVGWNCIYIKNMKKYGNSLEIGYNGEDYKIRKISVQNKGEDNEIIIHTTSDFPLFQELISGFPYDEDFPCDECVWFYKTKQKENVIIAKIARKIEIYSECFIFSFDFDKQNETLKIRDNQEKFKNKKISTAYIAKYLAKQNEGILLEYC
jgi:hypothetical protein